MVTEGRIFFSVNFIEVLSAILKTVKNGFLLPAVEEDMSRTSKVEKNWSDVRCLPEISFSRMSCYSVDSNSWSLDYIIRCWFTLGFARFERHWCQRHFNFIMDRFKWLGLVIGIQIGNRFVCLADQSMNFLSHNSSNKLYQIRLVFHVWHWFDVWKPLKLSSFNPLLFHVLDIVVPFNEISCNFDFLRQ